MSPAFFAMYDHANGILDETANFLGMFEKAVIEALPPHISTIVAELIENDHDVECAAPALAAIMRHATAAQEIVRGGFLPDDRPLKELVDAAVADVRAIVKTSNVIPFPRGRD